MRLCGAVVVQHDNCFSIFSEHMYSTLQTDHDVIERVHVCIIQTSFQARSKIKENRPGNKGQITAFTIQHQAVTFITHNKPAFIYACFSWRHTETSYFTHLTFCKLFTMCMQGNCFSPLPIGSWRLGPLKMQQPVSIICEIVGLVLQLSPIHLQQVKCKIAQQSQPQSKF